MDVATTVLKGFKNYLIKKYGHEARKHFTDAKYEKRWANTPKKRNYTVYNNDWDEEVGDFIKNPIIKINCPKC